MKVPGSKRLAGASMVAALFAPALQAQAQEAFKVSVWGGSWQEMIAATAGRKFTEETGVKVQYVTGGTIDRLNKAKLAKGKPETDVTLTTSHVGWLYAQSDLFEKLQMDRIVSRKDLMPGTELSPYHLGVFSYVYTIGYRPDLVPKDLTFSSWKDLWDPRLEGKIGVPDYDPSHLIAVSAMLAGTDTAQWQRGSEQLKKLKPNIKAFYSSDAISQNLMSSGETAVQVILSASGYYQLEQGVNIKLVVPKEGAIVGIDTVSIDKGSKNVDLAYKFINALLDPTVQAEIAKRHSLGPMNTKTKVDPKIAALPGMFTTADQMKTQAIIVDAKLRAGKLDEWKRWFAENIMN